MYCFIFVFNGPWAMLTLFHRLFIHHNMNSLHVQRNVALSSVCTIFKEPLLLNCKNRKKKCFEFILFPNLTRRLSTC